MRPPADHRPPAGPPTARGRWLTLAALVFAVFIGLSGLDWVVNAYVLSFAVLLLTGGAPRRYLRPPPRLPLTGPADFIAASLLAGLAPSAGVLIAARVLQGAGAAADDPAHAGHHRQRLPRRTAARHRHRVVGRRRRARGRAGAGRRRTTRPACRLELDLLRQRPHRLLGPAVGAHFIPESRDHTSSPHLDLPGLVLSTGALFSLTDAVINANDLGWTSPTIIALLTAAAAGLGGLVAVERRAHAPMIDLALFRKLGIAIIGAVFLDRRAPRQRERSRARPRVRQRPRPRPRRRRSPHPHRCGDRRPHPRTATPELRHPGINPQPAAMTNAA